VNQLRAVARRPATRIIVWVLAIAFVGGAIGVAMYVGSQDRPAVVAVASPTPRPSSPSTPNPTASPAATIAPTASPEPTPAGPDPVLGTDGRLTVLLLGSDYRPSHSGNRTDVIMVVSLDPATGAVAAASIPRDTVNFPTSSSGKYRAKVNGLYQDLIGQLGQRKAAREMKRIIGNGIGVEIDSYAVVGFEGVRRLVDAVGGVDVVLDRAVVDPYYWVTSSKRGVSFRAGSNHLNGATALIFARTRKGDNDFERARRQQLLVAAAVRKVREQGVTAIPKLVAIADRFVRTDLPFGAAPKLFEMVSNAGVDDATRIVFGPSKWASAAGGSSYVLKLDVVRDWTATYMAPVPGSMAAAADAVVVND
jgi:LCP family protein required for cell wall assembly